MLTTPFAPQRLSRTTETADLLRLIAFEVAGYWLAVPVSSVVKVINAPPIVRNNNQAIGMVNLGMKSIAVIDLHYRLTTTEAPQSRFLILTLNRQQELFGIPTANVPGLLEIPVEIIRPLPTSYRQVDPLGIASHVAILNHDEQPLHIYLLGLQYLLDTIALVST